MNVELLIAGVTNLFTSLVCIAVSIPLLRGRVKRNSVFGVRLGAAQPSEENWFEVNRYGGWALLWWSIPVLLLGGIMVGLSFLLPPTESKDLWWLIPLSLTSLLILGALFQTVLWSRKKLKS